MKVLLHVPAALDGQIWRMSASTTTQRFAAHRHAELEVNLVLGGRAVYLLEDRKFELQRHTQIWLFPAQNHVLLDYSADFAMWILVFKPAMLQRVCTTPTARMLVDEKPAGEFCKQLAEVQARRLHGLFNEVAGCAADPARYNAGLAYAMLEAWAAQLAADVVPAGDNVHPAVERAVRLLRYEDQPLALPAIARHAGLSPSRLSRLFKAQTGVALVDFRNRQRIERFLTLYGTGQRMTMIQAALDAGFGSYPQFHRVFKQVLGCSPQDYRRGIAGPRSP